MENAIFQLCSKISKLETNISLENFIKAENLNKTKYPNSVVINPLRLCDHITEAFGDSNKEAKWEHYMDICRASIKHITHLVTLDNIHESRGCKIELKDSFNLGKEIVSLEEVIYG